MMAGVVIGLVACTPSVEQDAVRQQKTYQDWLSEGGNTLLVSEYQGFLNQNGSAQVLDMHSLLSNQRDFSKCAAPQWMVPPKTQWKNIIPALKIVDVLQKKQLILSTDVVTSSYRDVSLNQCAGGSSASKHLTNHALDVQLRGADAALRYNALCAFWSQYGADLKFGLGFYGENQIHIDGAGWRTWGADYTRKSSPCHR